MTEISNTPDVANLPDFTKSCGNEDLKAEDKGSINDFEIYRLDYETKRAVAAGGEFLEPGDHVYMWCTLYQHHGIILSVESWNSKEKESHILISEFTNLALMGANTLITSTSNASGASSVGVTGGFRIVEEKEPSKWHKVKYQANPLECLSWRPGTCSGACPSSASTILTRVYFLKDCQHLIPDYQILTSNCETVAVWCVTGKWETLQGDRAVQFSKLGALSSMTLLPVAPAIGVAATGLALWHSAQVGSKREEIEKLLNKEFEWYAMGKTPKFDFKPL
mmetsp:Transcript_16974/g.25686  ORF Transcript_16974/g.25686 Transcript_16974/m.25686 type:complete len:279 (+) Transcript_16974:121-957(+)|eukprot:CAMPEP_0178910054 /NCGR_PEP_ID=MMETSP0786-20121207/8883_1 /TAXON_ID=186022 /ORGANISM="Thalassionema frauenfeldii, Strain CCMP 1798" /LENGTH=278 /DNA_ID=CAMNT_0020582261 /DNA_START=120 /DNA_END=956 /DNA_ORIENTATION=-